MLLVPDDACAVVNMTLLIHPRIELMIHRRFRDSEPGPLGLNFERSWVPRDEQVFRAGG